MASRSRGEPDVEPNPPESTELLEQVSKLMRGNPLSLGLVRQMTRIDETIMKRSQEDLEGLCDDAFRMSLAVTVSMHVRAQWVLNRQLEQWGKGIDQRNMNPPKELLEESLPRLQRIQEHLMNLTASYVKAKHILEMTKEREVTHSGAVRLRDALRRLATPVAPAIEAKLGILPPKLDAQSQPAEEPNPVEERKHVA